jgi:predicted DNA-binding transcriptional regulator YafY
VVVIMALRQRRPDSVSASELVRMFAISRKTLMRWFDYFQQVYADAIEWQRVRGRLSSYVTNDRLFGTLLEYCIEHAADALSGLVACCRLLATGG